MDSGSKARIAIAGAGLIGRAHIARVTASERTTLVGIADPVVEPIDGIAHFHDLEDLLDSVPVDGVILATPNNQHRAGVDVCAAAGVVPLIEKPLAGSLADGEAIVAALASAEVASLVGHHRRHSTVLRSARDTIHRGALGRIVAVSGLAAFAKPADYFDVPWRRSPGGGPVLINLVHEIDDLRFLLGDITEIVALTSNEVRGFEVEDTAAIAMRFESGALGTFLLTDCAASPWSWEQTSGENLSYDHHGTEDCYRVMGTSGSMTVPDLTRYWANGPASWWSPLESSKARPPVNDPLADQLDHFVDVMQGVCDPVIDAADALETLRATLAVLEAAKNGVMKATKTAHIRTR